MDHFIRYIGFQRNNILLMILWLLIFFAVLLHWGWKTIDICASELDLSAAASMDNRRLRRCSVQIPGAMLIATVLMSALALIQNLQISYGVFFIIEVAMICISILLDSKNRLVIHLFSNIRGSIPQMLLCAFFIGATTFFYRGPYNIPATLWSLPLYCRFLCLWSLFGLYQLLRPDPNDAHYVVPALSEMIVMCTYVLQIVVFWCLGGYYTSLCTEIPPVTISSWLQGIFLYSGGYYATSVRLSGLVHLLLLAIPVIGITKRALTKTLGRSSQLKLLLPAVLTAAAMLSLWITATKLPTLSKEHSVPIISEEAYTTSLKDTKDATIPVLQNGAYIQLCTPVFIDGEVADITVTVLDDFSDRPYFRYFAKHYGSSSISIWAENQGAISAENCVFELGDEGQTLSDFFPKEMLQTTIEVFEPGTQHQLFVLTSDDMIRREYERIPLVLKIQSEYTSSEERHCAEKEIQADIFLDMNGISIEHPYSSLWITGPQLEMGIPLRWSQFCSSNNNIIIERFQCSQTVLVEIQMDILHYTGGITHLEPFLFVYEHL